MPKPKRPAAKKPAKPAGKPVKPFGMTGKKHAPRADLGQSADGWFNGLDSPRREIAAALRKLILGAGPGLIEALKWGMPNYTQNGLVAGLMAAKEYVSLFLFRGAEATDPDGLLSGSGRTVRALKVHNVKEIPAADVKRWIREMTALNARG